MENERKEYKEKKPSDKQIFYFNDKGQLVVETNKGIWVDGERYVKMYGDFTCNAKTMGEIIRTLKGTSVEVGVCEKIKVSNDTVVDDILNIHEHTIMHYCVLGADMERVEEYEKELAKKHCESKQVSSLKEELKETNERWKELEKMYDDEYDKSYSLKKSIENFNRLPWWKRMFKKIEVK